MGRGAANRPSPYIAAPIAFSGSRSSVNNFPGNFSDQQATGIYGASQNYSLTTTTTILSLQGPGVVNYLEFNTGSTHLEARLIIDDVVAYSATHTNVAGTASGILVGWRNGGTTESALCWIDNVPFRESFVFTLRSPTTALIKTTQSWRLTRG